MTELLKEPPLTRATYAARFAGDPNGYRFVRDLAAEGFDGWTRASISGKVVYVNLDQAYIIEPA